ncbi:MAG: phenylalanine--tRNA ligase subunit beta, partial [Candidatus Magasanikbacteria bacterium]|nr:phenylalanine--tRNA ligase subunit beta [Candidatus Magasanikbacteria bacterium]
MLISKEWLSEFVDLGTRSDEKIAQEFSLRTAEVEGVVSEATALEKICIGEIIEVAPHPNADRLRVTKVDVGEHVPLSIVCGGTNLAVGMKVVIARVGSRVQWHGAGELVTLEPAEIRGVKSDGMICGADEIGLAAEFPKGGEKEILDLSAITAKPGTPLAIALGKNHVLFEIDNKSLSNRPDLWGMRGM